MPWSLWCCFPPQPPTAAPFVLSVVSPLPLCRGGGGEELQHPKIEVVTLGGRSTCAAADQGLFVGAFASGLLVLALVDAWFGAIYVRCYNELSKASASYLHAFEAD